MKNIELLRFGPLPDDLAAIAREAGRDPGEFVFMAERQGSAWVIWDKPEAPTWADILSQPLANAGENTFLDFWWDIRDEWQWVCESNFGIESFRKYLGL